MKRKFPGFLCLLALLLISVPVLAGVMSTVSQTAQIQPMNDGSGKYMLKSDGFYCLEESGNVSSKAEIHYLDHYEIDGTVFHGYYYHDTDGMFRAGNPHLVSIKNMSAIVEKPEISEETGSEYQNQTKTDFSGIFLVGNLGKMGGAPRTVYFDGEKIDGITLQGYYYFNANGRLIRDIGTYYLKMFCNDRMFDGYYYFGGQDGALSMSECETPDGYQVDENGRLKLPEKSGIKSLEKELKVLLKGYEGNWSVYIKDIQNEEELLIADQEIGSASLIKLFVMAATYQNMDEVLAHQAALMNCAVEEKKVKAEVDMLLWNMITISDNEAYHELVRLQTAENDFKAGCRALNQYLKAEGYIHSRVRHTLQPSGTDDDGIGGANTTSAKECGQLLEKIYRGQCVSKEASEEMLHILSNQEVTWKIRAGLPDGILCANKSGENSTYQHDVGIVYGENRDYIICVLSEEYGDENLTFDEIRDASKLTYTHMNMWRVPEEP